MSAPDWLADAEDTLDSTGPLMPEALRRRMAPYITLNWQESAQCASADPEAFFPEPGAFNSYETRMALRICAACPVRRSCLVTALSEGVQGVWAGTGERPRRDLIRELLRGRHIAEALTETLDAAVPAERGEGDMPRTPRRYWSVKRESNPPLPEPKTPRPRKTPTPPIAGEIHPFGCSCDYHAAAAARAKANRARKAAA